MKKIPTNHNIFSSLFQWPFNKGCRSYEYETNSNFGGKIMKRRKFFAVMGAAGAAGVVATGALPALAAPGDKSFEIANQIGRNHGHALDIDEIQVIEMLRATQGGEMVDLDIQGRSSHPHTLTLSHQNLLDLVVLGEIAVQSRVDGGHAHNVQLTMSIAVEPEPIEEEPELPSEN